MYRRLAKKVIVVTGAAGGIGALLAQTLAHQGAYVIAADLTKIPYNSAGISQHKLDVTSEADWIQLREWIKNRYGKLDGLVNNAGISNRDRLGTVCLGEWNQAFSVNCTGALLAIQTLSPLMSAGSSIVNIASIAAITGHYAVAYSSSKWALRGLSRAASLELGPKGIRVNTVMPGAIETPMTSNVPASVTDKLVGETPLGRLGQPEDITGLIVYLLSDESTFISGAEIPVDGGHTGHCGMKSVSDAMRVIGIE
ncbi:SDR family oxidoreductase [Parahaliea maris]|uniref:SDR family oxidoreductase n=2 Tax=Parahaliea maris TaxID=2716870 RepID=A0A5C9A744_9GAMM|nr:SDR family oxidoreductase [Parahaliea maris]